MEQKTNPNIGLNVAWRKGNKKGRSDGLTYMGMKKWQDYDGESDLRSRIHFARIYGTKPAFGNFGVQDYVYLQHEEIPKSEKYKFKMRVWKNLGNGGTKVIMDGNKYCNMVGRASGAMDYVWTWSFGRMVMFPNAGKTSVKPGESWWEQPNHPVIWQPPKDLHRRFLHLADWDNDGDCDIIYSDPDTGSIRVWINDFPTKKTWDGAFREIEAPKTSCSQKPGIGIDDLAVRMADITGNGRADYLCIHKDGKVEGYLHGDDDKMTYHKQLKFAEGRDRANLRWSDVNGDGRADMIWVDKFTGDARVWYSEGPGSPEAGKGSTWYWRRASKPVFDGNKAGTCNFYPDLDGNGRADMHSILGTWTNQAQTWLNPSCGLSDNEGDDKGGVVDPRLPMQPGNPVDGPGPGEEGNPDNPNEEDPDVCRKPDDRDWRKHDCCDKYIRTHTKYSEEEVWNGLGIPGAWLSALEFYDCAKIYHDAKNSFSNFVSDFFHGHCFGQWLHQFG